MQACSLVGRWALLLTFLLLSRSQPAASDPPAAPALDLAGLWRGGYAYAPTAGKAPVAFTAILARTATGFQGTTCERATFGDGTSPTLTATVGGAVSGERSVRFTKRYDGRGGQSHEVAYEGTLSTNGRVISGTWSSGSFGTGTFTMELVLPVPDVAGAWKGSYTYVEGGGAAKRVEFAMLLAQTEAWLSGTVVEPATFGDRSVESLTAAIREGTIEPGGLIRFVKRYDGRGGRHHEVQYEGRLAADGRRIDGTWSIRPGAEGTFEMIR